MKRKKRRDRDDFRKFQKKTKSVKNIFFKSVPISFYFTRGCPPRLPASLRDSCEPSRVRGTFSPPQLLRSAVPASPSLPHLSDISHSKPRKENRGKNEKSKISNPFLFLSRSLGDVPARLPTSLRDSLRAFPRAWHLLPRLSCSAARPSAALPSPMTRQAEENLLKSQNF